MELERLRKLKHSLMCTIENQMCNIYETDAEELGNAIDMLKDIEEAMYYCTITDAMHEGKRSEEPERQQHHYYTPMMDDWDKRSYYVPPIHYSDSSRMYYPGGDEYNDKVSGEHSDRVAHSKRMYMEARQHQGDKAMQMRELEKYMQELSQDIVEMIQDASPEERQYLEKKMNTLAAKVGQMK